MKFTTRRKSSRERLGLLHAEWIDDLITWIHPRITLWKNTGYSVLYLTCSCGFRHHFETKIFSKEDQRGDSFSSHSVIIRIDPLIESCSWINIHIVPILRTWAEKGGEKRAPFDISGGREYVISTAFVWQPRLRPRLPRVGDCCAISRNFRLADVGKRNRVILIELFVSFNVNCLRKKNNFDNVRDETQKSVIWAQFNAIKQSIKDLALTVWTSSRPTWIPIFRKVWGFEINQNLFFCSGGLTKVFWNSPRYFKWWNWIHDPLNRITKFHLIFLTNQSINRLVVA